MARAIFASTRLYLTDPDLLRLRTKATEKDGKIVVPDNFYNKIAEKLADYSL